MTYLRSAAGQINPRLAFAVVLIGCALPSGTRAEPEQDFPGKDWHERGGESRLANGFRLAKHLGKSHTLDVLKSPLTSVADLLSVTLYTGRALVKRADIRFRRTPQLNQKPIPSLSSHDGMDLAEWDRWLDQRVAIPETGGDLEYLVDGDAFFRRLTDAICTARKSIWMQTYIFDNDDVAKKIADCVKEKSSNLDVRMLYDGLGTIMAQRVKPQALPQDHQAPVSMHDYLQAGKSKVRVRRIQNHWLTGDHTKNTIIDHELAFVGGMNIGREYRHDWHDMMVEIRGPAVRVLERMFESTWKRTGRGDAELVMRSFRDKAPKPPAGKGIRFLQTAPGCTEIADVQLEAIRRARNYIYIENAYFSDDEFIHELCKARKRGVDVRVIIPTEGNHAMMQTSNKITVNQLIKNGVVVYRYPGMSHIKAAIFDGWACFGTANYDKMSLVVNRELNIGTSQPDAVERLLNQLFIPDMEKSMEVKELTNVDFLDHVVELIADEA